MGGTWTQIYPKLGDGHQHRGFSLSHRVIESPLPWLSDAASILSSDRHAVDEFCTIGDAHSDSRCGCAAFGCERVRRLSVPESNDCC